jgi:hypothetical protein
VVPVRYSVCTPEQVARAWRLDLMLGELIAMTGEKPPEPYSVRGYLRRQRHSGGSEVWSVRLESLSPDGECVEASLGRLPAGGDAQQPEQYGRVTDALCRGDGGLACCASPIVDGPHEVIWESGVPDGAICVIDPTAPQGSVVRTRRVDDRTFDSRLPLISRIL